MIFWGGVQQGYSGFAHNPADYAAKVDCPVLMLQGKRDRRVMPEQAQAVFDNLRGPKQLVWFEENGHESYFKRGAQPWRRSVEEFLERELSGDRR
ncbi:MAG TPA: prolyl oligopeptidase family serine peptidase [Pirellulales bacterium]|nr:prolyl oligopeptidase family serine peptidase [Pirellulales bacterium]